MLSFINVLDGRKCIKHICLIQMILDFMSVWNQSFNVSK